MRYKLFVKSGEDASSVAASVAHHYDHKAPWGIWSNAIDGHNGAEGSALIEAVPGHEESLRNAIGQNEYVMGWEVRK